MRTPSLVLLLLQWLASAFRLRPVLQALRGERSGEPPQADPQDDAEACADALLDALLGEINAVQRLALVVALRPSQAVLLTSSHMKVEHDRHMFAAVLSQWVPECACALGARPGCGA